MNPSQLIAWLVCLSLAFFAAALSVSNSYRTALLDRKFAEVQKAANEQGALLSDIRGVLTQIERDLRAREPEGKAAETNAGPAKAHEAAGAKGDILRSDRP